MSGRDLIGAQPKALCEQDMELTKVGLGLCLTSGETLLVVVTKQLVEEVDGFV